MYTKDALNLVHSAPPHAGPFFFAWSAGGSPHTVLPSPTAAARPTIAAHGKQAPLRTDRADDAQSPSGDFIKDCIAFAT
jgi:hypothetical protein